MLSKVRVTCFVLLQMCFICNINNALEGEINLFCSTSNVFRALNQVFESHIDKRKDELNVVCIRFFLLSQNCKPLSPDMVKCLT